MDNYSPFPHNGGNMILRPRFDRGLEETLSAMTAEEPLSSEPEVLLARRERLKSLSPSIEDLLSHRQSIEHLEFAVPSSDGERTIPLSVLRQRELRVARPCIYFVHGGGMTRGDRFTGAECFPQWIDQLGVVVASIEYRLAPEHMYPAAIIDCFEGLLWIAGHADDLGIDRARIVIVGVSAGGGLAAATALMARDQDGPQLLGQMLKSPMLDDRNTTKSALQFSESPGWNRESNLSGWRAVLGDAQGTSAVSPYAAPSRASDLSNLPPAFIDVGSAEVFRDEAVDYASRIWSCGGQAELHVWPGGFHGFEQLAPGALLSQKARHASDEWLMTLFAAP